MCTPCSSIFRILFEKISDIDVNDEGRADLMKSTLITARKKQEEEEEEERTLGKCKNELEVSIEQTSLIFRNFRHTHFSLEK